MDRFGIAASAVCAVHCALGAILAGASGFGALLADERIEPVLAALAVVIASVALVSGVRRHGERLPLGLAAAGVLALLLARTIELPIEASEPLLSITGAAFLVSAHAVNLRALRRADACCVPVAVGASDHAH